MPAAVNSEEDEEDIGSEEEDDFVPSPYSRASLVPVEVDHCKVKRRAFSMPKIPSPSSSSFDSKLITIGELGGAPWECADEGKTTVKRDWQVGSNGLTYDVQILFGVGFANRNIVAS